MDIKEAPTIGEAESLIRNSYKKIIFQGMIKEEKKQTKHLVWLLKNPRKGNKKLNCGSNSLQWFISQNKKEMKTSIP